MLYVVEGSCKVFKVAIICVMTVQFNNGTATHCFPSHPPQELTSSGTASATELPDRDTTARKLNGRYYGLSLN